MDDKTIIGIDFGNSSTVIKIKNFSHGGNDNTSCESMHVDGHSVIPTLIFKREDDGRVFSGEKPKFKPHITIVLLSIKDYNMRIKWFHFFLFLAISSILVLACRGGDKEQAVDLGLSVLWSSYNLGAESETGYGWYLAWGETEEKDHYFYDNYHYTDSEESQTTVDIGADICGTDYDVATTRWGAGWRLPSEAEMKELIEDCVWAWETREGILGVKVVGPNGNSIFLPAGGTNKELPEDNPECAYWTGTLSQRLGRTAVSLLCIYDSEKEENTLRTFGTYKVYGLLVRPVKDK